MTRALAIAAALLLLAGGARAQTVPPPKVPDVPDEPLPEWHPPVRKSTTPLFLQIGPQMREAQKLRQAGLWISSIGWAQLFVGGIVYAAAADANTDVSNPRTLGVDAGGSTIMTRVFDPALEDRRDRIQNSAFALFGIGGTMAFTGFVLYTAGQARITMHHKEHPKDPLPPLSGY